MSVPTSLPTTIQPPPFQQWQNFYPGVSHNHGYGYDNNDPTLLAAINSTTRELTADVNGVSRDINQATLGLRDAVERGNLVNSNLIERTSGITQNAVERVAAENRMTTVTADAASRQAAADTARDIMRAVDHNATQGQSATERNGGNIMTAIERVAAENRMTTVTADAASRQAAADSGRDISVSVERNGANAINATQTTYAGLLASIERNAGETRLSTITSSGASDAKMSDVRHAILNDVNRGTNEIVAVTTGSSNAILNSVQASAWEGRVQQSQGFKESLVESLKAKADLSAQNSAQYASILLEQQKAVALGTLEGTNHYASLLLEQQKVKEYLSAKSDSQFAINQLEVQKVKADLASQSSSQFAVNQLEMQKVKEGLAAQASNNFQVGLLENQKIKEYLSSKSDGHFAMNQLELQKVKEGLAYQASQNFAINQLEQQKSTALISAQLAEAKYEALKTQGVIMDKVGECCCAVKEKIDLIDRDRLRDNLVVSKEDNNLLKILEFTNAFGGYGGRRSRSRSPGRHHH